MLPRSPPTKKALVDVAVKQEPFFPDRDGLHKALRMGGAADLDTSQCKLLLTMLRETYSCRSMRNQVVSREVLTKRRYVLEITKGARSKVQRFRGLKPIA